MTVVYYTTPHLLDISIEVIKILKTHVKLHVLIEIKDKSKKANIINIEKLPEDRVLVAPAELLTPKDYDYLAPYLDGVASANFVIFPNKSTLKTNVKVLRYIRSLKADIMHFETFTLRAAVLTPFLWMFKKVFLAIHDPVFHSGEKKIKNWLPRSIFFKLPIKKYLVFYSDFSKDQFEKHYKRIRFPKLVIKMRPYSYYSSFARDETIQKKHILFFGRISPYKGIDILLQSVPEVIQQAPEELFVVAGRSATSYTFNQEILEKYKNNISIINRYIPNEELASLIRNAKFVVCPYTDATQSGVLMTSYAFNTPVVATAVGAFPEYIEDHVTGILVHNRNAAELAEKIVEALKSYEAMSKHIENKNNGVLWESNRSVILEAYDS